MAGELKKFLTNHPEISSLIFSGFIVYNGDVMMGVLSSYTKDGFTVNSYVDDDNMTEEEKLRHHEELAEQAIRALFLKTNSVQKKGR